jgi:CPA2 family monovalent cation:H+ antiporter-2
LVFGLALSVASTVVLIRALAEQDALGTIHGRVAVGWLIVEDLFTVLILVLLPAGAMFLGGETSAGLAATAGRGNLFVTLGLALGKTALFVALMIFVGTRALPWLLVQVARTGSRELFTLAVLAVALGVAFGAAALFGVSLALGAFLAGMVLSESDLSHQAAADALPLRDAFAVLFFVSVGMLFNPAILLTDLGQVIAVLAIIILGKALAGLLLVATLGYPLRTGLTVAAGLSQIGEFSFIVAGLGRTLGLLPEKGYHFIIAGALLSISLNPLMFRLVEPLEGWLRRRPAEPLSGGGVRT